MLQPAAAGPVQPQRVVRLQRARVRCPHDVLVVVDQVAADGHRAVALVCAGSVESLQSVQPRNRTPSITISSRSSTHAFGGATARSSPVRPGSPCPYGSWLPSTYTSGRSGHQPSAARRPVTPRPMSPARTTTSASATTGGVLSRSMCRSLSTCRRTSPACRTRRRGRASHVLRLSHCATTSTQAPADDARQSEGLRLPLPSPSGPGVPRFLSGYGKSRRCCAVQSSTDTTSPGCMNSNMNSDPSSSGVISQPWPVADGRGV